MSIEVIETLRAARELLSDPKRWTKGETARRSGGAGCSADDPKADCWCAIGAVGRVSRDPFVSDAAWRALRNSVPRRLIADFNDDPNTTHADILAAFDRAIDMAVADSEQEQQA